MTDENTNEPREPTRRDRPLYSGHYEWSADEPLSEAVIEAIAEFEGIDYGDVKHPAFPPLQESVDTDSLDALSALVGADQISIGHVSIDYAGYTVVVHSDGLISVKPPSEGPNLSA